MFTGRSKYGPVKLLNANFITERDIVAIIRLAIWVVNGPFLWSSESEVQSLNDIWWHDQQKKHLILELEIFVCSYSRPMSFGWLVVRRIAGNSPVVTKKNRLFNHKWQTFRASLKLEVFTFYLSQSERERERKIYEKQAFSSQYWIPKPRKMA